MQDTQIVELYEKSESCRIVAEQLGVSDETVRRALIRSGIKRTHRHPKPPSDKTPCGKKYCWASVVVLRQLTSMSFSEIVAFTGIPQGSVGYIISTRCRDLMRDYSRIDKDEIEREYLAGATTYELGEKYNVNHATVSKWMHVRGHYRGKLGNGWQQECICKICGCRYTASTPTRLYCDKCSIEAARHSARKGSRKRYALKRGATKSEGVHWRDLIERDNGICQICGLPVDKNDLRWGTSGPLYPSQDHIVPLAKGGQDTLENSQLAHIICNSIKADCDETTEVKRRAKEQAIVYIKSRVG